MKNKNPPIELLRSTEFDSYQRRFLRHVEIVGTHWMWRGAIDKGVGYGKMRDPRPGGKLSVLAHRLSWLLFRGEIPENGQVLHAHEGPELRICVNPDHLFVGDEVDNSRSYRKEAVRGFKIIERIQGRLVELKTSQLICAASRIDELEMLIRETEPGVRSLGHNPRLGNFY